MINLLSKEMKAELAAAKRNVRLRQYTLILLLLGVVVTASYGVGYFLLNSQGNAYRADAANYKPEREKYKDVIEQATTYNKNLSIAKSIMSNEFIFSDLLTTIAKTLPKNSVLSGINLHTIDLAKPIELTINAKSYPDADNVKKAFQASPYFKDTKLRSITKMPEGTYPFTTALITTLDQAAFAKAQQEGTL
ncbi:hypothetical protein KA093_02225 [Candidatus Saccharibacteria bacterium]|nr:hypothetical protein [Candidatus Saccharibacteria bacterium]